MKLCETLAKNKHDDKLQYNSKFKFQDLFIDIDKLATKIADTYESVLSDEDKDKHFD